MTNIHNTSQNNSQKPGEQPAKPQHTQGQQPGKSPQQTQGEQPSKSPQQK